MEDRTIEVDVVREIGKLYLEREAARRKAIELQAEADQLRRALAAAEAEAFHGPLA